MVFAFHSAYSTLLLTTSHPLLHVHPSSLFLTSPRPFLLTTIRPFLFTTPRPFLLTTPHPFLWTTLCPYSWPLSSPSSARSSSPSNDQPSSLSLDCTPHHNSNPPHSLIPLTPWYTPKYLSHIYSCLSFPFHPRYESLEMVYLSSTPALLENTLQINTNLSRVLPSKKLKFNINLFSRYSHPVSGNFPRHCHCFTIIFLTVYRGGKESPPSTHV